MSPVGTPNYLTVAPDGSVGAAFSGHVSAQGIDFLHTDTSQNAAQQIRWLPDPPGGNQPGPRIIGGWGAGAGDHDESVLELDALSPYSTDPVRNPSQNPGLARLELTGDNSPVAAQINAQAWGASGEVIKLLLGSDGSSDYVMDSDTPPAASDLQGTYGGGLKVKPSASINNPVLSEIYLAALSGLVFPGLAAGVGSAFLPAGGLSTGLSATIAPSGSGRAFSFVRTFGGFVTTSGASLSWCYQTIVMGANIGIQVAVVNTTSVATATATFAPIVVVGYV
jgi:hypothetical protein